MARLPYADLENEGTRALVDKIVAERGKVFNLYKMLLHSPPVAEGWLNLLTAIRQQTILSGRLREMVILRIAVLNRADYEFEQHRPIALREGMTDAEIEALKDATIQGLDHRETAVIALCDEMTKAVNVTEAVFAKAAAYFSSREMVELCATIASYNLVSRFLEAVAIDHE